ncbi:MAG: dihydrodipicolinate synthase family protein [Jiangellaceae bacterium]
MAPLDELTGVGHIMITPFTPDEAIDETGLRSVADFAIVAGVDAVIPLGIMGEAHRLTDDERDQVTSIVVEQAAGRIPVIAGCSAESTVAALSRMSRAADLGADAAMVAPPRAVAGSPGLQLKYYGDLSERGALPIIVQDEPVTTGVTMTAATLGRIATAERAVAIKVEQVPSPTKISQILQANPDARCFGGLGGLYLTEELGRGAVGVMTGFALPHVLAQICREYAARDTAAARATFFHNLPLIRYEAQLGVGGVAIRKQLFVERGVIDHDTVRGPVGSPDPHMVGELRELIAELVDARA